MASSKRSVTVFFAAVFLIGGSLSHSRKSSSHEYRGKTPLTLSQATPDTYCVSKDEPTCEAEYKCKIQITCNGTKVTGWRHFRRRCIWITISDFPSSETTMKCQATFRGINSTKTEKNITLMKVYLHRKFGTVILPHEVHANENVTILCNPPKGYPPPSITWYKDDEQVSICSGRSLRDSGKTLVIQGVSTNDSGQYYCVANNRAEHREGPHVTLEVVGAQESTDSDNAQESTDSDNGSFPVWAVVIIVFVALLALLLAVYIIVKKRFSHFIQVDLNVREDIGEESTTVRTGFIQESLPPSFDASAVLSRQLCNAEPLGAGATGENSSVRRGDLVIYNNYNRVTTVNLNTQLNTVNTNMHTTNNYNVELEQNGGMTVEDIE